MVPAGADGEALLKAFLEEDESIGHQCQNGGEAIHAAAARGRIDIVRCCMEQGQAMDVEDIGGRAAAHWAASSGHVEIVKLFLARGCDPDLEDGGGTTMLHGANLEMTKCLLDGGASIDAPSSNTSRPLHWAVQGGDLEVVKLLLERKADLDKTTTAHPEYGLPGHSPLDYALGTGGGGEANPEVTALLRSLGATQPYTDHAAAGRAS